MAGQEFLRAPIASVLCAAVVLASSSAVAADWSVEPKIRLTAEYNDNHRLVEPPGEVEVAGATLDALVVLGMDTPQTSFDLTPRYKTDFFPGESEEETDRLSVRLGLEHRTQKAVLGVVANYIDEDLLWGYLPTAEVSDVLGSPTRGESIASSSVGNQRQRFDITPEASFALAPRWNLDLAVQYIDVGYSRRVEDESVPYSYLYGSAGLRYRLSDTSELKFSGGLGRYEPDGEVDTTGYGFVTEWSRRTSETAQMYVRGGFNRVEIVDDAGELSWETGLSGGAGVRWQFEVTSIVLDATHYVDPSSTGSLVNRDQLQFRLTRRFAPLFSVFLGARGIWDSGVGGSSDFRDRDYATGNVGFAWRFARQFSLGGEYRYVWREYEDAVSAADANTVSLGVTYEPKRR